MDTKNNLWSRRTNTSNLTLSKNQNDATPRDYSSLSRRNGASSSHGRTNPFSSATTPGGGLTSPAGGGSSAFGLGSGAFAAFGSAKTPKTPGNPFEKAMANMGSKTPATEKSSKEALNSTSFKTDSSASSHPLRDPWVFWTRPPISKANGYIEYEKTLHPIAQAGTVEEFWAIYKHLKAPSILPLVTDYHLFKKGVRPIWEDDENKRGGKWILRLKKGIADRYWEEILMACVGGQLADGNDDVNGAVLSVRNGEDIISIWTSSTGQRVLRVRDTMKSVLKCPADTRFEFKSHDESITQRATIDEQRREKANEKRSSRNNTENRNSENTPRKSQDEQRS